MPSNVVTIGKLTDEQAANIEDAGVEVSAHLDLEKLNLQEPAYGETFAFHAEQDEVSVFVELHDATMELERQTRELFADTMAQMGEKVRESDLQKPWHDVFADGDTTPAFASDDHGEAYFKLSQRRALLHALLHWKLGERSGLHAHRFGMRKPGGGDSRLRVYRLAERRW